MKFLIHLVLLLAVTGSISTLAACGISKDDHEKIEAEHKKTMTDLVKKEDELDKTMAELEKTKIKLEQANHELAEKKSSLMKTHNQINMALEKCSQERKTMETSFIAARREVTYLRDKMDELIQSFKKVSDELNLAEKANEILRQQMNELTAERDRLKKLVRN